LDKIFEKIIAENGTYGSVTVHSTSPWLVTFDDFMTDDEANAIISVVDNWERSTDTGQMNEHGVESRIISSGRTSSNAWCRERCESHPLVQSVISKIEQVTQVPYENYESFQILRYEMGQFYQVHHDSSYEDFELVSGTRILTMFLYLSDVEEGGETSFPNLKLSVKPKKGRAVLWPGVMNHDPNVIDRRTMHEARPVKKGIKYGANSWIHQYNFKIANLWGCTGAFD
jgi:prolyl 4-hydroxylase